MNYLQLSEASNLGGHPLSLNDLQTLQNSIFDLMHAVSSQHYDNFGVSLLGPPKIVISGGNFSSSIFHVILFGAGQVVRVRAASNEALSLAAGAKFYIRVTASFGANDPVLYEDGSLKNVHIETVGDLVHTATPGGDDYPFTHFNVADWTDGSSTFSLSGLDTSGDGYFEARYRLISGNTMLIYMRMKGEVTGQVKINLPVPYSSRNNFTELVWCQNTTVSEDTAKMFAGADATAIIFNRTNGSNFSVGNILEMDGIHYQFEVKLRDV